MTIVFFSNVLNHHQVALCDELFRQNNGDFYFVETANLDASRQHMGFRQFDRKYTIHTDGNPDACEKARRLAVSADVAIMGAESFEYLKLRIANSNGVTFSYSERWLKQGWKNIISPNILRQFGLYLGKGRKRKWYMLAASGYLANDLSNLGIFKNRVFKWGYFPKYSESEKELRDANEKVRILWTARFIDWKRPYMMIGLAKLLMKHNYDFEMTMIGSGIMANEIRMEVTKDCELSKRVKLKGNIPNEEVLSEMLRSDIYCFTSTRREGWGAVLGEAMASECCPVASSAAGATPFLINNNKNGLIFKTDNLEDLYKKVTFLIDNPKERRKLGCDARETMLREWNAERAAKEFLSLAKMKLSDGEAMPLDSTLPASPAYPVQLHKTI